MLGDDAFPSWMEPAWKRNLRKFFSRIFGGVGAVILMALMPGAVLLATWLLNIAFDLHLTFGEHLQATLGFIILAVVIGAIADK